jgi:hypothetical protein
MMEQNLGPADSSKVFLDQEAAEKIGRHFRVLDGELSFISADDALL